MAWFTQFPRPLVLPWVDLRALAGGTYSGWTVASNAGIYKTYWHASINTTSRSAGLSPYRPAQGVIEGLTDGVYGFDRDGAFLRSSSSFTYSTVSSSYNYPSAVAQLATGTSSVTSNRSMHGFYEIRTKIPDIGGDWCTLYAKINGSTLGSLSEQWYLPALTRATLPSTTPLTPRFLYNNPIVGTQNGNSSYSPHAAIVEATGIDGMFYTPSTISQPAFMRLPGLYPSRPIAAPPRLVEECKATDLVTVGGNSYTCRHSVRRVWEIDLLLDGSVDCFDGAHLQQGGANSPHDYDLMDEIEFYERFLKQVEIGGGCTFYIDADDIGCQYTRPRPYFCGGYPSEICGRLTGATNITIQAQKGLSRRYPITLRIAEQELSAL